MSDIEKRRNDRCVAALKSFPLPAQSMSSEENYRRILGWIYGKHDVASLIIDLDVGSKEPTQ